MTMAHPELDDLSAYHDGEAPEWAEHVAGCATCSRRLDELVALSAVVGTAPEAGTSAGRADAVARAMAAALGPVTRVAATVAEDEPQVEPVVTVPSGWVPSPPVPSPTQFLASDRSRRWLAAASVAAVLVLGMGLAAVIVDQSGGGRTTTNAVGGPTPTVGDESPTADASAQAPGPGTARNATTVAGDIGEIPDAATLVGRVGPAVQRARAAAATKSTPASEALGSSTAGSTPPSGVAGSRPCEMEARARGANLGEVVYLAIAVHAGEPAVVLGFAPTQPTGPVRVEVLAQSGCRLLLDAAVP